MAAASALSVGSSSRKSLSDTSRSHPLRRKSCRPHNQNTNSGVEWALKLCVHTYVECMQGHDQVELPDSSTGGAVQLLATVLLLLLLPPLPTLGQPQTCIWVQVQHACR
jgi:hypothetical protein